MPARADDGAAVPAFDLRGSRFDQETYFGRLQQINVVLDPLKLLVTTAAIEVWRRQDITVPI